MLSFGMDGGSLMGDTGPFLSTEMNILLIRYHQLSYPPLRYGKYSDIKWIDGYQAAPRLEEVLDILIGPSPW